MEPVRFFTITMDHINCMFIQSCSYKVCCVRHPIGDGGFCCIGVACVVWGIATPEQMGVYEPEEIEDGYGGGTITITEGKKEYYKAVTERVIYNELVNDLVSMNDEQEKTFNEIADWIEAKL